MCPYSARGGDAIAELYGSICDGWNAMHTALGGELAVGACGLNQKFHPIDDSTGLATFLTLNDDEVGNVLIRVCAVVIPCPLYWSLPC